MKRSIVVGSILSVTAIAGAAAAMLLARPAMTQGVTLGPGLIKPSYTAIGVASVGTSGSAAWLLDPHGNRVVVCSHGAASGCTRYDLP